MQRGHPAKTTSDGGCVPWHGYRNRIVPNLRAPQVSLGEVYHCCLPEPTHVAGGAFARRSLAKAEGEKHLGDGARIIPALEDWIAQEARRSKRPKSAVLEDLLEEAVRSRRFPGIVFRGPAHDRRAVPTSPALDVWEVIEAAQAMGARQAKATRSAIVPPFGQAHGESASGYAADQARYPTAHSADHNRRLTMEGHDGPAGADRGGAG